MTRSDSTAAPATPPAHARPPRRGLAAPAWAVACLLLLLAQTLLTPWMPPDVAAAQVTAVERVYVAPIEGTIEPGIGAFLERALEEAEEAGASIVILDINTPGGRLDTVLQMRDAILDSPLRVVAFVNREAFSAGALITIAADEIWMTPAAVFGAATPVLGGSGETADEKTISAVRSTFRATAEENGRDPAIAEAMVDPAVVVEGLDSSTALLTLTTAQARAWGYADGVATDVPALLAALGASGAQVTELSPSPIEQLVRWITDPLFASLLITAGLFLIIADALFAGFGIAAVAGVTCLGLFFWGHALAGFAGWEDLLLVALGLVLIALEIFVIPGFGVAGIAGIVALAAGLVLAMSGRGIGDFEMTDELVRSAWAVVIALALVLAGLVGLSLLAPRATGGRSGRRIGGLALAATVDEDDGRTTGAPRAPGWLVRRLGGGGVLERGDLQMPDGPAGNDRRPPA